MTFWFFQQNKTINQKLKQTSRIRRPTPTHRLKFRLKIEKIVVEFLPTDLNLFLQLSFWYFDFRMKMKVTSVGWLEQSQYFFWTRVQFLFSFVSVIFDDVYLCRLMEVKFPLGFSAGSQPSVVLKFTWGSWQQLSRYDISCKRRPVNCRR